MADTSFERMGNDALIRAVVDVFASGRYPLSSESRVRVQPLVNPNNFNNRSFKVGALTRSYHVKLTHYEDCKANLRRWLKVGGILHERHHAPAILGWVDIDGTGYSGLVFEDVEGHALQPAREPSLADRVLKAISELHADAGLARRLEEITGPRTYLDAFVDTYIHRFDADLEGVRADLPPFVSTSTYEWMVSETRTLEEAARRLPALKQRSAAPVHSDLNPSNVLVAGSGSFAIIDWDDLSLGDPALDYVIFLWDGWSADARARLLAVLPSDASLPDRLDLYVRAQVLNEVIDSLADWVEAAALPANQRADIRAAKEKVHRKALRQYKAMYGSHPAGGVGTKRRPG